MSLFALKLILTPLLIASITLIARRWGPVIGGWLVGLPLTSGPVSAFLALEHGPEFAAAAATSAILATLSVITFSVAYTHAAQKTPWYVAAPIAMAAFFLAVALFSRLTLPAVPAAIFACAVLCLLLVFEKKPSDKPIIPPAMPWDIPFRMVAATVMVLCVTAISERLGPTLSGLLSAIPIFICVMSAFSHKLCGPESVQQFERGVIIGSFAFAAFFLTVSLSLGRFSIPVVYLLATMAALGVNACIMAVMVAKKRLTHSRRQR